MNSQLHEMLEAHSHDVRDLPVADRLAAVRGRVQVVRRRRRAGVALAAALVVAASGAMIALPSRESDPAAARTLAGHVAPATFVSTGYTFAFDHAVEGDDAVVLDLPRTSQPVLVSWASTGSARLTFSDEDLDEDSSAPDSMPAGASDFGSYEWLIPGEHPSQVRIEGDGPVAIALYTRTDLAPEGITADGITFRDDRAGHSLITGQFGEVGQNELTLSLTMPERPLVLTGFCHAGEGLQVNITLNGSLMSFGSCDDPLPIDGGWGDATFGETPGFSVAPPGYRATVRIWVTRGNGDDGSPSQTPAEAPGVRLGYAAYEEGVAAATFGNWSLLEVVEHDGHHWQFVGLTSSERGERAVSRTVAVAGGRPVLLKAMSTSRDEMHEVRAFVDGAPRIEHFSGAPGGFTDDLAVLRSGEHQVELRLVGEVDPSTRIGIAEYVRID